MNYLKAGLIMISMMLSFASFGQHQHSTTKDLLKDKGMQDSIMTAICKDHGMMDNMMKHMMHNKSAMQQMMQNKEMMSHIAKASGKDSSMCQKMMAGMMENKDMHGMMMDMMMKNKMEGMSGGGDMKQDSTANKEHSGHH